jgi:hypothetical protein
MICRRRSLCLSADGVSPVLHLLVRNIVERLQRHRDRIEWLPEVATIPHLIRYQHHGFDGGAKILPRCRSIECLERVALRRQWPQSLVRIKEPELPILPSGIMPPTYETNKSVGAAVFRGTLTFHTQKAKSNRQS